MLKDEADIGLIELVRKSLKDAFDESGPAEHVFPEDPETVSGVFVTLKHDGMLRGCRGCMEGRFPLHQTVWEIARSSAFDDPRFDPLTRRELDDLEISVSLLGEMESVDVEDPSQFQKLLRLGRDGICLRLQGRSALFLPEVATEQGWDVETTLSRLCRKAGLEEEEWRNPETEILRFQTKHLEA